MENQTEKQMEKEVETLGCSIKQDFAACRLIIRPIPILTELP